MFQEPPLHPFLQQTDIARSNAQMTGPALLEYCGYCQKVLAGGKLYNTTQKLPTTLPPLQKVSPHIMPFLHNG